MSHTPTDAALHAPQPSAPEAALSGEVERAIDWLSHHEGCEIVWDKGDRCTCGKDEAEDTIRNALATPKPDAEMRRALEEGAALINEINERASFRAFYGIDQRLHAKLCTIRATLVRALTKASEALAQGLDPVTLDQSERVNLATLSAYESGRDDGRREGLEEAAKVAEAHASPAEILQADYDVACQDIATAIRALSSRGGEG